MDRQEAPRRPDEADPSVAAQAGPEGPQAHEITSWATPLPPSAPPKKSRWPLIAAVVAVVMTFLCAAVLVKAPRSPSAVKESASNSSNRFPTSHNPGSTGPATALTLSLQPGGDLRYQVHMTMSGTLSAGGQKQPISGAISARMSWHVVSVDRKGVATVELKMRDLAGTMGGQAIPARAGTSFRIRVAPDGRVLSSSDLGLGSVLGGSGLQLPGSSQISPLLPDDPVKPGDTWKKDYTQAFPFGAGRIHLSSDNTYLRNETIGGVKTAVIQSTESFPFDFTLDFRELLRASGSSTRSLGLPGGADLKLMYTGKAAVSSTDWLDIRAGQVVRGEATAWFDLDFAIKGVPAETVPGGNRASYKGSMTLQIDRLPGGVSS
jgi:hypothetical protein